MTYAEALSILELDSGAGSEEIRKAYRRMARRWHPDLFPEGSAAVREAEEQMKLINEAYAQLRNGIPPEDQEEEEPFTYTYDYSTSESDGATSATSSSETTSFRTQKVSFWRRSVVPMLIWLTFTGVLREIGDCSRKPATEVKWKHSVEQIDWESIPNVRPERLRDLKERNSDSLGHQKRRGTEGGRGLRAGEELRTTAGIE